MRSDDVLAAVAGRLESLMPVVRGTCRALWVPVAMALIGALLVGGGFIALGAHWLVGIGLTVVCAVPALLLHRFRTSLRNVQQVPDILRELPEAGDEMVAHLGDIRDDVAEVKVTPFGLVRTVRSVVGVVRELASTTAGRSIESVVGLTPTSLIAAGMAAAAGFAVFAIGALVVVVAVLT